MKSNFIETESAAVARDAPTVHFNDITEVFPTAAREREKQRVQAAKDRGEVVTKTKRQTKIVHAGDDDCGTSIVGLGPNYTVERELQSLLYDHDDEISG